MFKLASRTADLLLVVLVAGVLAIAALPHVAPQFGVEPLIIRGRSMSPSIPLGAVVFVREVAPEAIRAGDVVTIRAGNGMVFTHRVLEVIDPQDDLRFRTKGDANDSEDQNLTPSDGLVGRVESHVPVVGFLTMLASRPSGMASILAFGAFLFLFGRLAEELHTGDAARRRRKRVAVVAHGLERPVGTGA